MTRLIDNYLKDVEVRRTVRNWPSDVNTVIDGYRAYTTISHAVQKDAIQNGWSARKNKRGKEWSFTFELIESRDNKYFLMTDAGTTGLTGKILTPEEYEMDLPGKERWGRFEGVAFTQPRTETERTLGSRGRGKFVFVGTSKEHTILYDTLREDRTYRFGFRTVKKTESPIFARDGDAGKALLQKITKDLIKPLSSVGARVIIVNPTEELIENVKNGSFTRHVGETWWEIISKYNAAIKVKAFGKEQIVHIPEEFTLIEEDSRKFKVWIKENQKVPASYRELKIKKLHIVYNVNSSIPDDIRGIAIQRDGMKICSIEPRYFGREIAEKLYGYIIFDSDTEEALLEDEGIEHYSFDFRRSLPGTVKRFVEDEVMKFAHEKLGYGVDTREIRRQQQRNAERRALIAANSFARALGIGAGPGTRSREGIEDVERPWKKIRIQLDELSLPRHGDLRVNYGESAGNIGMRIVNDKEKDVDIRVKLFLRFYDKPLKTFFEGDVKVRAHSTTGAFGPYEEAFLEGNYPDKGKYTIVAKINSLMDEDKGADLDYKTQSFYIEEDPPMRGLFERCEAFGFPDEDPIKYWMGYSEYGSERGLVLNYNVSHPGYAVISATEEDLAEYIIRIAGQEICRYDLMQENSLLFSVDQRTDPQEILKQERKIVGELVYKFRMGEI